MKLLKKPRTRDPYRAMLTNQIVECRRFSFFSCEIMDNATFCMHPFTDLKVFNSKLFGIYDNKDHKWPQNITEITWGICQLRTAVIHHLTPAVLNI
jgi:hypothetical protein